eukprot:8269313-Pyramimonas_sp.AAC.2
MPRRHPLLGERRRPLLGQRPRGLRLCPRSSSRPGRGWRSRGLASVRAPVVRQDSFALDIRNEARALKQAYGGSIVTGADERSSKRRAEV